MLAVEETDKVRIWLKAITDTEGDKVVGEPGVDVCGPSQLHERIIELGRAECDCRTEDKFQMLTAFDYPVQACIQIWNNFIFAGETIVKDVVIPKTEAGAWSEQDHIFDDRKPIIKQGISLIDILVDRVSIWTFPVPSESYVIGLPRK